MTGRWGYLSGHETLLKPLAVPPTAAGSMWWVLVFSEPCRDHDDKLSEVCLALLLPSSAMRSGPGDVSVTDTLLYSAVVPRHNEMKRKNPSS